MTPKLLRVLALALATSALPATASIFSLNPLSAVTVGSSLDVAVQVTNVFATHPGDAVSSYGFTVAVGNSSVLTFTGQSAGPLFTDFSGAFDPTQPVEGFATAGFLAAGDFTEPLTLAILHFFVNAPGSSSLAVSTDLTDLNQGLYYLIAPTADPISASTAVGSASTTPEPGTMVFSGLAALALFVIRSRR